MFRRIVVSIIVLSFSIFTIPLSISTSAADICQGINSSTKIWWDGVELKVGQIGRLTIVKDTRLYKLEGEKESYSRTLRAGESYRIYAFKPGRLSVGGGFYVDRDSSVHYETPSKTKLTQSACRTNASIHTVEIGDSINTVTTRLGTEKRKSLNEYGVNWYTYHQNYQDYYMISYLNNKVAGVYSNSTNFMVEGVMVGISNSEVKSKLGEPLSYIPKDLYNYMIEKSNAQQTFLKTGNYITVFYDLHQSGKVTAIQVITSGLESLKKSAYGNPSYSLQKGLEIQLFDLVNSIRAKNNLKALTWDDRAMLSSEKHSQDMAVNKYFDHTNLKGEDPFKRMSKEGISYHYAGENIAMGYSSSIFAHEALMNSAGHRKNILKSNFSHLGVGVFIQTNSNSPYYTQNFFTP
jgi:uncharacterized protein YkwD